MGAVLSDGELLERLRQRDDAALAELYRRLAPAAYALALRLLESREEAEEVLQDTFVRLHREAAGRRDDGVPVRAFVFVIARNLALSRLRARAARPQAAEGLDPHEPDFALSPSAAPDLTTRLVVTGALERLDPADRRLVEDAFFQGLTHAELAERDRLPLGTVKARLRRALLKMRGFLERA